jgi:cell fate (sporulation/competence/biofilm development) regulator YlbF (YheA/YmcA/DUF963 family)
VAGAGVGAAIAELGNIKKVLGGILGGVLGVKAPLPKFMAQQVDAVHTAMEQLTAVKKLQTAGEAKAAQALAESYEKHLPKLDDVAKTSERIATLNATISGVQDKIAADAAKAADIEKLDGRINTLKGVLATEKTTGASKAAISATEAAIKELKGAVAKDEPLRKLAWNVLSLKTTLAKDTTLKEQFSSFRRVQEKTDAAITLERKTLHAAAMGTTSAVKSLDTKTAKTTTATDKVKTATDKVKTAVDSTTTAVKAVKASVDAGHTINVSGNLSTTITLDGRTLAQALRPYQLSAARATGQNVLNSRSVGRGTGNP